MTSLSRTRHFPAECDFCQAEELIVARLNGDNFLDIAVTTTTSGQGRIYVYMRSPPIGTGEDLVFAPPVTIALPRAVRGLAVADFDGDGYNDLAAASDDPNGPELYALRNDQTGNFPTTSQFMSTWTLPGYPGDVVSLKFDTGTKPDLAVANPLHVPDSISVLRNISTPESRPEFEIRTFLRNVPQPLWEFNRLAAGKLSSDNLDDLAFNEVAHRGGVNSFLNDGAGGLLHRRDEQRNDRYYVLAIGESSLGGIDIGNLNGGTRRDVAVTESKSGEGIDLVDVLVGNGDGTFQRDASGNPIVYRFSTSPAPGFGQGPDDVIIVDLNDDGVPDLVTSNRTKDVTVLINSTPQP